MSRQIALLSGLTATIASPPLFGAELAFVPYGTANVFTQAMGGWSMSGNASCTLGDCSTLPWGELRGPHDSPAPIDDSGWPTCDAYIVVTLAQTWAAVDPTLFLARYGGNFTVRFKGTVADLVFPPQMNATVSDVTVDNVTFSTSLKVAIPQPPTGGLFGIAIGFAGSRRNSTAPSGSGVTSVEIVPDSQLGTGSSTATHASHRQVAQLWGVPLINALRPFHHVRTMQWTYGWYVTAPFSSSSASTLNWAERSLPSDAVWGLPGYVRPKAFGAPWESVILLAQECQGIGIWINVPVEATGTNASDTRSYVYQLALLLRDGNAATGGAGVPEASVIYIEHSNEVWLNGSAAAGGGPSLAYKWNKAAAEYEVAHDAASNLNSDGVDDPETWAYRRHARRVIEIGQIFRTVFGADRMLSIVRPVLGWSQAFSHEGRGLVAWLQSQYTALEVRALIYGLAVNAYSESYVPAGSTISDVVASWNAASDAQAPLRVASAALASDAGWRLLSYEGSLVGIPADDAAINGTTSTIIAANRSPGYGDAMRRDYEQNWAALGGAEFNFFALSSQYGEDTPVAVFQWGLTEDVGNLSSVKYQSVLAMLNASTIEAQIS